MARVEHPNVVTIYDAGSLNAKQPYIVMEYLRGDSLGDLLHLRGPIHIKSALEIVSQCCNGLEAAHKAGVIHRDIKPDNVVILDRNEHRDWVKLVDFGIARLVDATEKVTADGIAVGTLDYMAPEQLEGHQADERSDLYSLSVLLFESLTGKMPYEAINTRALIVKQLTERPRLPSQVRRDLQGSGIDTLIEKGMSRNPQERFQSAREFAEAANHLLGKLTV
ncbi:MAG: serine/threonine protein kinase [Candidatus Obscuribacterales bacterium]|nr:serine/threonine protein kinase [Candidatus Obscuribacterales bacterium]